jgi:hypothetical protein
MNRSLFSGDDYFSATWSNTVEGMEILMRRESDLLSHLDDLESVWNVPFSLSEHPYREAVERGIYLSNEQWREILVAYAGIVDSATKRRRFWESHADDLVPVSSIDEQLSHFIAAFNNLADVLNLPRLSFPNS